MPAPSEINQASAAGPNQQKAASQSQEGKGTSPRQRDGAIRHQVKYFLFLFYCL
jgi:hypothetical protein